MGKSAPTAEEDYRSLYRKYRPRTFSEVIGQELNVRILQKSLDRQQIAHAYLFAGPRGSGKTSVARLLAKGLNCSRGITSSPCGACAACESIAEGRALDVVEMDAASNRGVEDIRDLREKVKFTSTQLRYKVYILDEVHMLTKEAFNAFLKTLEEPPQKTVFVLATTDPQRVPATIQSRCMRLEFRPIAQKKILGALQTVAKKEKLHCAQKALERLATASDGSLRDALALLEQASLATSSIDEKSVNQLLGWAEEQEVQQLLQALSQADAGALTEKLQSLFAQGKESVLLTRLLLHALRDNYLAALRDQAKPLAPLSTLDFWLRELSKAEYWLRTEQLPTLFLEATLLKLCAERNPSPPAKPSAPKDAQPKLPPKPSPAPVVRKSQQEKAEREAPPQLLSPAARPSSENPAPSLSPAPNGDLPEELLLFLQEDPPHAIPYLLAKESQKKGNRWIFTYDAPSIFAWQLAKETPYRERVAKALGKDQPAEVLIAPDRLELPALSPEEKILSWFPGATLE